MDRYKYLKDSIKNEGKSLLFIDIETKPLKTWAWKIGYDLNISHDFLIEDTAVISVGWKKEGDKKVSYRTWDKQHNDKTLLKETIEVINKADIVVAQNGIEFDLSTLQWRANVHQLPAIRDITVFDTLKLSRKAFKNPSHKLDYRSSVYGLGGKIPMRFQHWLDVINDKPGALKYMVDYMCKDVDDLQALFWRELPYYKKLPASLAMLINGTREHCPRCASGRQAKYNIIVAKVNRKQGYECNTCGHKWVDSRAIK